MESALKQIAPLQDGLAKDEQSFGDTA